MSSYSCYTTGKSEKRLYTYISHGNQTPARVRSETIKLKF